MRPSGKIIFTIAALLLCLSVYVHFTIGFWGDQDWELLAARQLLEGWPLYSGIFMVNPPLIVWLYAMPAGLALLTHLADYHLLVALTLALTALIAVLSVRLIASHAGFADSLSRREQFIALLAFVFVFRMAPSYFGDREHLFLLLTFPYLLRWLPGLSGMTPPKGRSALLGVLAGIGFCLKPHCLLVFAGAQLLCLLRKDRPRILGSLENRCLYTVVALYLMAVAILCPIYLSVVLPMALLTYSAISAGPGLIFDYTILITLALTFAMFRPNRESPFRRDIYYLLGLSLLMLLYGLINQGWGYTWQPVLTYLLVLNAFVLWEFAYFRRQGIALAASLTGIVLCSLNFIGKAAIVLLYNYAVLAHPCHGDARCESYYAPLVAEAQAPPRAKSFAAISMNFDLWSRVDKLSGVKWVGRFPQFWMIPKFIVAGPEFAARNQWILYYVANAVAEDLERQKPDLAFVDESSTIYTIGLRQPFDWIGAFSGYDAFRSAWKPYHYVHTLDLCGLLPPQEEVVYAARLEQLPKFRSNCRFQVYRRMP